MFEKARPVLKVFAVLIGAVLIFAAGLIGWLTVTEHKPDKIQNTPTFEKSYNTPKNLNTEEPIKVLTFNIGYGNLGKESDFFMDGGKNVRNGDKELVLKNMEGIIGTIENAGADILFLQEVDENSKRSFSVNETQMIWEKFGYGGAVGTNYKCSFVPFPWPPIGTVDSGIMTVSDYDFDGMAQRISLPCPFSWPVSAANLKRCLLVSYHNIEGTDKQLVAVNFHLEAYDDGEGKIAQTKMLWEILEAEYTKGNYVVAGGDFNQMFPGTEEKYPIFATEFWVPGILEESGLPEGWQYVFDESTPTCRLLDKPYDEKSSQHYVIDGFIISPNVELIFAETLDCGFEFSDHNPVLMEIILK